MAGGGGEKEEKKIVNWLMSQEKGPIAKYIIYIIPITYNR